MREQWFQLLRKQLKSEHGKGLGVRAMRGKVQLTLRLDENTGMNNRITLETRFLYPLIGAQIIKLKF